MNETIIVLASVFIVVCGIFLMAALTYNAIYFFINILTNFKDFLYLKNLKSELKESEHKLDDAKLRQTLRSLNAWKEPLTTTVIKGHIIHDQRKVKAFEFIEFEDIQRSLEPKFTSFLPKVRDLTKYKNISELRH